MARATKHLGLGSTISTTFNQPYHIARSIGSLDLLSKAVWQRWAYVSYFSACEPGREDAAAARMEKVIAATVPEFQMPPAGR